jgi:hypothetical protein
MSTRLADAKCQLTEVPAQRGLALGDHNQSIAPDNFRFAARWIDRHVPEIGDNCLSSARDQHRMAKAFSVFVTPFAMSVLESLSNTRMLWFGNRAAFKDQLTAIFHG